MSVSYEWAKADSILFHHPCESGAFSNLLFWNSTTCSPLFPLEDAEILCPETEKIHVNPLTKWLLWKWCSGKLATDSTRWRTPQMGLEPVIPGLGGQWLRPQGLAILWTLNSRFDSERRKKKISHRNRKWMWIDTVSDWFTLDPFTFPLELSLELFLTLTYYLTQLLKQSAWVVCISIVISLKSG